jgi:uncharacterized repeat protein (TIGR01451 family)
MRTKLSKIFSIVMVIALLLPLTVFAEEQAPLDPKWDLQAVDPDDIKPGRINPNVKVIGEIKGAKGPATYIVQLKDAPLASYRGGVNGLDATYAPLNGETRLNVNSPASKAYLNYLDQKHQSLISAMQRTISRNNIEVSFEYKYAFNGMAVVLTPEEAAAVAGLPDVIGVQRDFLRQPTTDASPTFLGAAEIWNGTATGGLPGTKGEGVIIGVLDTGINMDHPSFAEIGPIDGYVHLNPYGSGIYAGWCNPTNLNYDPTYVCNDKLIGAWDYVDGDLENDGPYDHHSHGSHTASTAGGNYVTATITSTTAIYQPLISGMAPHANIIMYDVCDADGCPNSATLAATDQTILDGVDVINYSIGGGSSDPWSDDGTLAFLGVVDAGIIPVTSAGNDGPGAGTMGSPADGPWMLSVGNSTHDRIFYNKLLGLSGSNPPPPGTIMPGKGFTGGYGPALIVYAGDYPSALTDTPELCGAGDDLSYTSPWPAGTFNGEIVVCDRGIYGRMEKGWNVKEAGAGGYVLANVDAYGESTNGDAHYLPAVHIGDTDGDILRTWLSAGTDHQAQIKGYKLEFDAASADIMAAGSSRGPNPSVPDVIKPDIAAPGTNILAAYRTSVPSSPPEYGLMSGTSMASPHVAGAAALLRALYPAWTPTEIKSALMTTAWPDMLKEDVATPTDPFDMGTGRLDLHYAGMPGLVLDETTTNYLNADPSLGGDPKALNIPSFGNDQCLEECSWSRIVSSPVAYTVTWTADITVPVGMTVTVTPGTFELGPYGDQEISVSVDVSNMPDNEWVFASFSLGDFAGVLPAARFPIAVIPATYVGPDSLDIPTRRNAGSIGLEDLYAIEITDLTVDYLGLVRQTVVNFNVNEVPNPGFPEIFFQAGVNATEIAVPVDTPRLVVEIIETTSPDLDMLVLFDSDDDGIPEQSDIDGNQCQSAAGGSLEACDILNPVPGRWFALVANFEESGSPPDDVTLYTAVVPNSDSGNMTVTGPSSVTAGDPFDLRVYWDTPTMQAGDRWYGAFSLGTDPGNPGDITTIPVTITRHPDDVDKTADVASAAPGEVVTYEISVQPNVTAEELAYMITDTIPAGMTYVPASLSASEGTASILGDTLTWDLSMPVPVLGYVVSDSDTDPSCDTGFGGYVNLADFGIYAQSGISGDSVTYTAFSSQNPFNYYGVEYTGMGFADDGFAIFDLASNYGGDPYLGQLIPDPALPNNVLAVLWQDMEIFYSPPPTNTGVTLATAGKDLSIIEYDNLEYWSGYGLSGYEWDFEIVMYSTVDDTPGAPEIVFAYDNLTSFTADNTVGLENADGNRAAPYLNLGDPNGILHDGLMVCFDYQAIGATPATLTYQVTVDGGTSGEILTNYAEHNTGNPGSKAGVVSVDVEIEEVAIKLYYFPLIYK